MYVLSVYRVFHREYTLISQVNKVIFPIRLCTGVDNDIKADIFDKMLVTDLEAIQKYHTGDLLTR